MRCSACVLQVVYMTECVFVLSPRGPVCLCCLCGESVFSGGQWRLQLPLPSHTALHEGLPLPVCCHHPLHPHWNNWVILSFCCFHIGVFEFNKHITKKVWKMSRINCHMVCLLKDPAVSRPEESSQERYSILIWREAESRKLSETSEFILGSVDKVSSSDTKTSILSICDALRDFWWIFERWEFN